MNGRELIRAGKFAAAALAILGVGTASRPLISSDPPPWASKQTVDETAKVLAATENRNHDELEALILEGQIRTMWGWRCNAAASRNLVAARSYDNELSQLQARYQFLMHFQYPLRQCL